MSARMWESTWSRWLMIGGVVLALTVCGYVLQWQFEVQQTVATEADEPPQEMMQRLHSLEEAADSGAEAVEELVARLETSDLAIQRDAALALGWIGPEAVEAVPALALLIDHEDMRLRDYALTAIGRIGTKLEPLAEPIALRLLDDSSDVRTTAAKVLICVGPAAAPTVISLLGRADLESRRQALTVLDRLIAVDPEILETAVPILRQVRDDRTADAAVCQLAASLIVSSEQASFEECRFALRNDFRLLTAANPNGTVSLVLHPGYGGTIDAPWSLHAIRRFGPDGAQFLSELKSFFAGNLIHSVYQDLFSTLRPLGSAASPVSFWVASLNTSKDPNERAASIDLLRRIGLAVGEPAFEILSVPEGEHFVNPPPASVWSRMTEEERRKLVVRARPLLSNAEVALRQHACRVLARFGTDARYLLPELLDLLDSDDPRDQIAACEVLAAIGPGGLPALKRLRDRIDAAIDGRLSLDHETACLRALEKLGPEAGVAVPKLLARFGELRKTPPVPATRDDGLPRLLQLLRTLAALGAPQAEVVPAVQILLDSPRDEVALAAAALLVNLGADVDAAIARLALLLDSFDPQIALHATILLGELGPRAQSSLDALSVAANSPEEAMRVIAPRSIAKIAVPASDARDTWTEQEQKRIDSLVATLTALLDDRDFDIRREAVRALGSLGTAAQSAAPRLEEVAADWRRGGYWQNPFAAGWMGEEFAGLAYLWWSESSATLRIRRLLYPENSLLARFAPDLVHLPADFPESPERMPPRPRTICAEAREALARIVPSDPQVRREEADSPILAR